MKLITTPRPEDDLAEFGELLKFTALVYVDDSEGEPSMFEGYNMDGDVAFFDDLSLAEEAFDQYIVHLKEAEDDFIDNGDEEGMVALFNTPKGYLVLATSTLMGFSDIEMLSTATHFCPGMPHVTWNRIIIDMFDEDMEE
jgi:hypothetical protein